MAVVPLRVLGMVHPARRSDLPAVTHVIGGTRIVRASSVAGMPPVVLRRRRVTGVRAASRVFLGNHRLRVSRRPLISHFALGIVAHVVKLPNVRAYALFPFPRSPAPSDESIDASHQGGRKPARVTETKRLTAAFERWAPAPVRAWTQ